MGIQSILTFLLPAANNVPGIRRQTIVLERLKRREINVLDRHAGVWVRLPLAGAAVMFAIPARISLTSTGGGGGGGGPGGGGGFFCSLPAP